MKSRERKRLVRKRQKEWQRKKKLRRSGTNSLSDDLSIIIPAFRAEDFIEDCVESIKKQLDCVHECLIGVDGCKKTFDKLLSLDLPNCFSVFWFERSYPYIIRNTLATKATGKTLFFFDADDWLLDGALETVKKELASCSCVRMSYKQFWEKNLYDLVDPEFPFEDVCTPHIPRNYDVESDLLKHCRKKRVAGGVLGIKKWIFLDHNGFRPWKCGADTEFHKRVGRKHNIKRLMKPVFARRLHGSSLTVHPKTGYGSKERNSNTSGNGSDPGVLVVAECKEMIDTVSIITTLRCQNSCPNCTAKKTMSAYPEYSLSMKQLRAWLVANKDSGYSYKKMRLTGGEPFLWENIVEGLKLIREFHPDIEISAFTNAEYAVESNRVTIESVLSLVDKVNVSDYGRCPGRIEYLKELGGEKARVRDKTIFCQVGNFYKADEKGRIEEYLPANCGCPGVSLWGDKVFVCANSVWMFGWRDNIPEGISTDVQKDYLSELPLNKRDNYDFCSHCVGNIKVRPTLKKMKNPAISDCKT